MTGTGCVHKYFTYVILAISLLWMNLMATDMHTSYIHKTLLADLLDAMLKLKAAIHGHGHN